MSPVKYAGHCYCVGAGGSVLPQSSSKARLAHYHTSVVIAGSCCLSDGIIRLSKMVYHYQRREADQLLHPCRMSIQCISLWQV